MVKILKISNAVLISLILIITMFANGCSREEIPFMKSSEKSEKALKVYTKAIEELKNEEDFDLKLTTSLELKEISCSLSAFNSILKKVVNHRLGEVEDEVVKFSFKDGVLTNDNTIVPKNIVQPVNSDIDDYLFSGVTSSYIYSENNEHAVFFTIGEEAASIDEIMNTFEKLKDEVGTDFGNYDIHKEYPEINSLAKYHSNFINIMNVASRISHLMLANNKHEHSKDDSTRDYGDFGKTTKIENGTCHIGQSEVIANIDDKGRLRSVIFRVPLGMDVNVLLMHNSFKAVVSFEICQTYEYSYPD